MAKRIPAKTYLERLDRLPPNLCRLIARTGGHYPRILTLNEIAARGGLTWQKAAWVARQKSWRDISVGVADQFRRGCGITIDNERKHIQFLARSQNPRKTQKPLAFIDRLSPTTAKHRKRFHQTLLKAL